MNRRQGKISKNRRVALIIAFLLIMPAGRVTSLAFCRHFRMMQRSGTGNALLRTPCKSQINCRALYNARKEISPETIISTSEMGDDDQQSSNFADIAHNGQAELLLSKSSLEEYYDNNEEHIQLMDIANTCRHNYRKNGIAHIPNFVRVDICKVMVKEATLLADTQQCFYSTEEHTVYQEPHDPKFSTDHPRNALQQSSKWIMDYDRIVKQLAMASKSISPLVTLYTSPHLKAFVSYVVQPDSCGETSDHTEKLREHKQHQLYESGCPYNAAYYNKYDAGDGLGWHFDRSEFGVNLELQPSDQGGDFELCRNTRSVIPADIVPSTANDEKMWAFENVEKILKESSESGCSLAERIRDPPVGPGSLVFFAGSRNLHRVTPVSKSASKPRINAIMTYETKPDQKPNAYSLQKFFGR